MEGQAKTERFELNVTLYAKFAGQEWSNGTEACAAHWGNNNPHSPYFNLPLPNSYGNALKAMQQAIAENKLSEVVHVRKDGFMHVLPTDAVFYADKKSLAAIESVSSKTISRLAVEHPEVLSALRIG